MILSKDQNKALEELHNFVFNNDEYLFLLKGRPGVGKTTVIREFVKQLKINKFKNFLLCAPTHKAAGLLSEGTGEKVKTIHQFLSLSPRIDLLLFDAKDLKFSGKVDLILEQLLIIDEASMINDELFDTLVDKCKKVKIIFIADLKQLQPVKANKLSKVSLIENNFELTTNHRQNDETLIKITEDSRNNIIEDFSKYESDNVILFNKASEMAVNASENFKMQAALEFQKFCKVLTYTNKRVEAFNSHIHASISNKEEYCYNELLTGYSGYSDIIKNSEDFIVKDSKKITKNLSSIKLNVTGYELKIKSLLTDNEHEIFILERNTPQNIKDIISKELDDLRIKAIQSPTTSQQKFYWKAYYDLEGSFCIPFDLVHQGRTIKQKTLDYGYAITLHKSQGSTYDLVYYDNNSIQFCYNLEEKRQLQHVALSRVSEQLCILI